MYIGTSILMQNTFRARYKWMLLIIANDSWNIAVLKMIVFCNSRKPAFQYRLERLHMSNRVWIGHRNKAQIFSFHFRACELSQTGLLALGPYYSTHKTGNILASDRRRGISSGARKNGRDLSRAFLQLSVWDVLWMFAPRAAAVAASVWTFEISVDNTRFLRLSRDRSFIMSCLVFFDWRRPLRKCIIIECNYLFLFTERRRPLFRCTMIRFWKLLP